MKIGAKIKAIRLYLAMTQPEFGAKVGAGTRGSNGKSIETIQVSKWENDQAVPSVWNLESIASLGRVKIDDIINNDMSIIDLEKLMHMNGLERQVKGAKRGARRKSTDKVLLTAEEIKEMRGQLGMTQIEFGAYVGSRSLSEIVPSGNIVSSWEIGRSSPSLDDEQALLLIKEELLQSA